MIPNTCCLLLGDGAAVQPRVTSGGTSQEGRPGPLVLGHHQLVPSPQRALEEECCRGADDPVSSRPHPQRSAIYTQ